MRINLRNKIVVYFPDCPKLELNWYENLPEINMNFLGSEIDNVSDSIVFQEANLEVDIEKYLKEITVEKKQNLQNNGIDSLVRDLADKFIYEFESASHMHKCGDSYKFYFFYNIALDVAVKLNYLSTGKTEHYYLPKNFSHIYKKDEELKFFRELNATLHLPEANKKKGDLLEFFYTAIEKLNIHTDTEIQAIKQFLEFVWDSYLVWNFRDTAMCKAALAKHFNIRKIMTWQEIKPSSDNTHFLYKGKHIFDRYFIEILKFHAPGLAPVKDETGAYHIDSNGNALYSERYTQTFGYYCNCAAVCYGKNWFHINDMGKRIYPQNYAWIGNFQENICTIRDFEGNYFHIDLNGNRVYLENYLYVGDYKDGFSCVKQLNGLCKHIDIKGHFINEKEFVDLGVFHKKFATAKDQDGWFHINSNGNELYKQRYALIEPFYNGFALVTQFDDNKAIINEKGEIVHKISVKQ